MMKRLLVTLPLPEADREYAHGALAGTECRFAPSVQTPLQDLEWAEIVLGNLAPPERLLEFPNIRWLHSPNVGLDVYQDVLVKRPDLLVSNCRGISTDAVAEHALALLLGLSRALPLLARQQANRQWLREPYIAARCPVWKGRQVHVLGYGEIARSFIEKVGALGVQITVYRRNCGGASGDPIRFFPLNELATRVSCADALVNFLPGLPTTRHTVNEPVFRAMKPTAFFVNVGRGMTVEEGALINALQSNTLAGAGLDVFENEPLSPESPLWGFPNVIISSHVAGRFDLEWKLQIDGFVQRLSADPSNGALNPARAEIPSTENLPTLA